MESIIRSYALFVGDEFACIFYYPEEATTHSLRLSAALKSDPKIVLDRETDIPIAHRYSVFVGDEFAEKLYLIKTSDRYPVEMVHAALQSNPKVVWIDSEEPVPADSMWVLEENRAVPYKE